MRILQETKVLIEQYHQKYNEERLHSNIGYETPWILLNSIT
ncbi:TPA: hypothetical protein EYN98_31165 [Candidatus Poribacteria bacterium]|nr:hypothetical protein [Candidatus Poribacteria bacterium]HIA70427.1 hypothetical protein [Candidatus Poribacteria bacterium]HIB87441.1 hypothetical protein [Candidatus Poribacteria bacterium]HIC03248.1 hypothetical protein [Candidatus Poribacteria bacterium]HIN31761.1 hypothetical protein [Candidatus Poribacteria bacterium]